MLETKLHGFIHGFGLHSFYCLLYSGAGGTLYKTMWFGDGVFIHFDSTGSIVKDMPSEDKNIKKLCTINAF